MSIKSGYPVRYAALNLKELEISEDEIFIAAKCHLVYETKNYFSNGLTDEEYGVVFSWDKYNSNIYPTYNENACINLKKVDKVFDNPDEALIHAHEINRKNLIAKMEAAEINDMLKIKNHFDKLFAKAYEIEKTHLEHDLMSQKSFTKTLTK